MGDLNAKVGSDNLNFERGMGREGCGVQNDNGEMMVEWCAFNNMIIWWNFIPASQHSQTHLDIPKWAASKPNRPPNG